MLDLGGDGLLVRHTRPIDVAVTLALAVQGATIEAPASVMTLAG
jgi:hypothetical protein